MPRSTIPDKIAFFCQVGREGDALRFRQADRPKLAGLRRRLGDLRGQRVLEPGCGAGHLTRCLAHWVAPGGRVDAFDPAQDMLNLARQSLAGCKNTQLRRARCETVRMPHGAFDRVICFRVLPHFERLDFVLGRFARWLRPGGRLHIVHWDGRARLAAIHGGHHTVAADVLPPPEELSAALLRHCFNVTAWIDNTEEVYVEAKRNPR